MFTKWPFGGTQRTQVSDFGPFERQSSHPSPNSLPRRTVEEPSSARPLSQPNPSNLLKRSRPEEEIDGGEEAPTQRKKRRLRLDLVTSRLSRPYADPATHIIGTKAWRLGAWGRQRFAGGKLLRKAAVLNQIAMKRKRELSESIKIGQYRTHFTSHPSTLGTLSSQRPSVQSTAPIMPSTYDAFDYDEYDIDHEEEDEEENNDSSSSSEDDGNAIYSDFRLLDSSDTDPEFFDTSWSFADTGDPELDPSISGIKLVMEYERNVEVSIAPTRCEVFPSFGAKIPVM